MKKNEKIISVFWGRNWHYLLIMLILFLCSINGVAQAAFKLEPQYLKSYGTLVRELGKDQWLMYNSYGYVSSFNFILSRDSLIPCYENTEKLYVKDFEILDDKFVYFCGEKNVCIGYLLGDTIPVSPEDTLYEITYDTIVYNSNYIEVWETKRRAFFGYFDIDDTVGTPLFDTFLYLQCLILVSNWPALTNWMYRWFRMESMCI